MALLALKDSQAFKDAFQVLRFDFTEDTQTVASSEFSRPSPRSSQVSLSPGPEFSEFTQSVRSTRSDSSSGGGNRPSGSSCGSR